jgi:uncharacterized protein (DUF39 family)
MEKYGLKNLIKKKLNIPITPENVYTNVGKHDADIEVKKQDYKYNPQPKNVKYMDELYSTSFMDDYFS